MILLHRCSFRTNIYLIKMFALGQQDLPFDGCNLVPGTQTRASDCKHGSTLLPSEWDHMHTDVYESIYRQRYAYVSVPLWS